MGLFSKKPQIPHYDKEGTDRKTLYGPKNIYQPDEREKFLDFAEAFRSSLEQKVIN